MELIRILHGLILHGELEAVHVKLSIWVQCFLGDLQCARWHCTFIVEWYHCWVLKLVDTTVGKKCSGWWWNTCVIGIIIFLWTSLLFGPSNSMVPLCWLHWGFIWWVGSCTQQYTFISWLSLLSKTSLCSHMSHPWQKKAPGNHSCLLTPIAMCYCCKTCIIFFEEELLCPTSVSNPNTSSTSTIRNWFRDALIFSCCFPFVI